MLTLYNAFVLNQKFLKVFSLKGFDLSVQLVYSLFLFSIHLLFLAVVTVGIEIDVKISFSSRALIF